MTSVLMASQLRVAWQGRRVTCPQRSGTENCHLGVVESKIFTQGTQLV